MFEQLDPNASAGSLQQLVPTVNKNSFGLLGGISFLVPTGRPEKRVTRP
jgi:hypothetical protein